MRQNYNDKPQPLVHQRYSKQEVSNFSRSFVNCSRNSSNELDEVRKLIAQFFAERFYCHDCSIVFCTQRIMVKCTFRHLFCYGGVIKACPDARRIWNICSHIVVANERSSIFSRAVNCGKKEYFKSLKFCMVMYNNNCDEFMETERELYYLFT